jgi:hypothetical protein
MKWALLLILACETVGLGPSTPVLESVASSGQAIRSCLGVAAGLRKKELRDQASKQVMLCYDQHFSPLEDELRLHNPKATLSLEYGFGVLARQMTLRHDDGVAMAGQLADRVEAVIDSTRAAPRVESGDTG